MNEVEVEDVQKPSCPYVPDSDCSECKGLFFNEEKKEAFGYSIMASKCECHDICVQDVRDIAVGDRTLCQCIPSSQCVPCPCPCNASIGGVSCRGGFMPDGEPEVYSIRVMCADESLCPGCDRINIEIGFEVVLRYGSTYVVVTPKDTFCMMWHDFAKFPSGKCYPDNSIGEKMFQKELSFIDGSSMVIMIKCADVKKLGSEFVLKIEYTIVDKLWKNEDLLVSAIKPYPGNPIYGSITVTKEFEEDHKIGTCVDGSCCCKEE